MARAADSDDDDFRLPRVVPLDYAPIRPIARAEPADEYPPLTDSEDEDLWKEPPRHRRAGVDMDALADWGAPAAGVAPNILAHAFHLEEQAAEGRRAPAAPVVPAAWPPPKPDDAASDDDDFAGQPQFADDIIPAEQPAPHPPLSPLPELEDEIPDQPMPEPIEHGGDDGGEDVVHPDDIEPFVDEAALGALADAAQIQNAALPEHVLQLAHAQDQYPPVPIPHAWPPLMREAWTATLATDNDVKDVSIRLQAEMYARYGVSLWIPGSNPATFIKGGGAGRSVAGDRLFDWFTKKSGGGHTRLYRLVHALRGPPGESRMQLVLRGREFIAGLDPDAAAANFNLAVVPGSPQIYDPPYQ